MSANNVATLVLIKPDKIDSAQYIVEHIEKSGLKIIKNETLTLSEQQIKEFYKDEEEWLKKLGKKIDSSCSQEGMDAFSKFNIQKDNYLELGKVGKKWNEAYLRIGPVVALLVGPNGSRVEKFFADIEETVEFLRMVLCNDYFKDANEQGRAFHNGIHLARDKEEFEYQANIIWPQST